MTTMLFNRIQELKEWKPMEPIQFSAQQVLRFNNKIETIKKSKGYDPIVNTFYLIDLEGWNEIVDKDYLKYLARLYVVEILEYIDGKGVVLEDIWGNIDKIVKEIIDGTVDEDYYLNTIDFYDCINNGGSNMDDLYGTIKQAIRLDNKRLLYYIIFKKSFDIAEIVSEYIGEDP